MQRHVAVAAAAALGDDQIRGGQQGDHEEVDLQLARLLNHAELCPGTVDRSVGPAPDEQADIADPDSDSQGKRFREAAVDFGTQLPPLRCNCPSLRGRRHLVHLLQQSEQENSDKGHQYHDARRLTRAIVVDHPLQLPGHHLERSLVNKFEYITEEADIKNAEREEELIFNFEHSLLILGVRFWCASSPRRSCRYTVHVKEPSEKPEDCRHS
mmetsp:Transcript_46058/g.131962  ORF Transcript_46058/g.131962 Transcript_46058/m.131962 type:complete len:212 (+) Transcript_46058:540-1175(+)